MTAWPQKPFLRLQAAYATVNPEVIIATLAGIVEVNPGIEATNKVIEALSDADASIRATAVSALQRLRDADAIPALQGCLDDPSSLVAHEAANASDYLAALGPM